MTIHKAVKGLHAVYIFLFLLNYIQRKFLATWLKIRAEPLKIWRSWWLSWLSLAVVASYLVEVAFLLTTVKSDVDNPTVYFLSIALLWSMIGIGGLPEPSSYLSSALIAGAFEIPLVILESHSARKVDSWRLLIRITRLALVVTLCIVSVIFIVRQNRPKDEETQPLLSAPTAQSDEDDENGDSAFIKTRQKERFQSAGNWWTYLKGYAIFLEYIIPRGDVKIQLCLIVLGLTLVADRAFSVLIPRQLGLITNRLADDNPRLPLKEVLLWFGMIVLHSSTGISLVRNFVRFPITQYSYRRITTAAFNHIMNLSIDFHNDKDSAEVIQAVDQGRALGDILDVLVCELAPSLIDLVIAYAYFYYLFGSTVFLLIVAAAVLYVYLDTMTTDWSMPDYRRVVNASRAENKTINQAIQGWQTVSFFNRLPYEDGRLAKAVAANQNARYERMRKGTLSRALMDIVTNTTFFGVVLIALIQISRGEAPVGSFVTLISFWDQLIYPVINMSSYYRWLKSDLISAERLLILFQTKPTIVDREHAPELVVKSGKLVFRDVGFEYEGRKATLDGINFTAEPGQTIAFVGETGGGKSTMFKMIYRFYDPKQGNIEIDGQDIRDVKLSSLRANLGIVDQSPYLFNISILENVRYGRLDATDEEIHAACKLASIHDKIMTFPDGYQSIVGDRGIKLSGGELQRVAIARVLLKNPPIVLLDEATSSVDTDTEYQIQAALATLSKGRTTFTIAHRLSTIISAHQILVIHGGKIIERGTHHELLKIEGGKYHSLWFKQVAQTLEGLTDDDAITGKLIDDLDTSGEKGASEESSRTQSESDPSGGSSTALDKSALDNQPRAN